MIERLVELRNLGVLSNALPGKPVELAKCTVVFGENGRGKTTLARLMASLATGDCSCLRPMATIGSDAGPAAGLVVSEAHHTLRKGNWSPLPLPAIVVFDSDFVKRNVYTGTAVEPSHRRNLCDFALGDEGVRLTGEVTRLDEVIKGITAQVGDLERALGSTVGRLMGGDEFIALPDDPEIDANIARAQKLVDASRDADPIRNRPGLQRLELEFPPVAEQVAVLAMTVEDLACEAVEKTRQHVQERLGAGGEEWLRTGVGYLRDESCPFCGQAIGGSGLVDAFRGYFGQAYAELRGRVADAADGVETSSSELLLQQMRTTVAANEAAVGFWAKYVSVVEPASPLANVEPAFAAVRSGLLPAFQTKKADLLSSVEPAVPLDRVQELCDAATASVASYNEKVAEVNRAILACQAGASAATITEAEASLNRLHLQKARWDPEPAGMCTRLVALRAEKKGQEALKTDAKRGLDDYMKQAMESYQPAVNGFLDRCNAAFSIVNMGVGFAGGEPRADYSIKLFGRSVSVATKPGDEPHFGTMLSDGDRRTLALAFFLARLDRDPNLADRIVVLDDPVSSLDTHRTSCTIEAIVGLATRCRQLIVMTHDPLLAMELSDVLTETGMAAQGGLVVLQLSRDGQSSTIRACDAADLYQTVLQRSIERLETFLDGPAGVAALDAVKSIRPAIEGLLRLKYPKELRGAREFGVMVARIRDAGCNDRLQRLTGHVDELYAVCNYYATTYMHVDRPHSATVPSDADALSWVKRAVRLLADI